MVLGLSCDIGWIMHLTAGTIYLCRNGFRHVLDYMAIVALTAVVAGVCLYCLSRKNTCKGDHHKASKEFQLWPDCIFRTGRGCYWNTAKRGVYECFIRACVDSDSRLFELRLGLADFPLIQKGNLLWSKMTFGEFISIRCNVSGLDAMLLYP